MRHISVNEKFLKRNDKASRQAFTLIELMIVVVVIAILLGLLLPAVMGVFTSARDAQVQMEIRTLEQGIAAFKAQYGIEPPSRITLAEVASEMAKEDKAILRRIWPRFDFSNNKFDLNNNSTPGEPSTPVTLCGAECLVFFLGGIRASDGAGNGLSALTGFSRNPVNPFLPQQIGEVRDGPFFEFKSTRLVASNNATNFLVYIDPLPGQTSPYVPYVYASSYEGRGYQTADLANGTASRLTNVYFLSATTFINPKTYQIISPGADHLFGIGGTYLENSTSSTFGLTNKADYDNLTNFHNGRLKP